jgi:hypothetical protein
MITSRYWQGGQNVSRMQVSSFTLGDEDRARLDAITAGGSRSETVRTLIRQEAERQEIDMGDYGNLEGAEAPAENQGGKAGFPDAAAGQGGGSDQGTLAGELGASTSGHVGDGSPAEAGKPAEPVPGNPSGGGAGGVTFDPRTAGDAK